MEKTIFLNSFLDIISKQGQQTCYELRDSMRTDLGSEEDNFHVTTLQIWQISDFGWAFACTTSSREHSTKLAIGLEM